MRKTRADVFLTERGFAESRTRAARLIEEGKVIVDGKPVTKVSEKIADGEHNVVITQKDRFVSRGGLKLLAAIEAFGVDVQGKRCIDIGASTGGFTDCLLQSGAGHVVAVDSGSGQLHESLIGNEKVSSIEGFNAKELKRESFGVFDVAVMDVSFISQTMLHKNVADVLCEGGVYVSLIKPQFEAGRSALSKKGIVKDAKDRERAVMRVLESAALCGFSAVGVIPSPIEGGDGNHEYVAYFKRVTGSTDIPNTARIDVKSLCK
jgi:23S rRNA (cytidine1920-2'-O)/16S rRNA (cytidine1409-2'-O)-methyltransferase